MAFDIGRLVEVYCPATDVRGSGYAVTEGVVVTAEHITDGATGDVEVRPFGTDRWLAAQVVRADAAGDVAIWRLVDTDASLITGAAGVVRVGVVSGDDPVAAMAVGFPAFQHDAATGLVDAEHAHGHLHAHTSLRRGRWALHVVSSHGQRPGRGGGDHPWAGMSGAAVFADGCLVGVVADTRADLRYGRLEIAPAASLLADVDELSAPVEVARRRVHRLAGGATVMTRPVYEPLPAHGRWRSHTAPLLIARYGVVPFIGRDTERDDIVAWCHDAPQIAARTVVGAAGVGKTRLAAECATVMTEAGWDTAVLDATKAPVADAAELQLERPTLLIIDYAEARTPLVAELIDTVTRDPGIPVVRVLLLARHTRGWLRALEAQSELFATFHMPNVPLVLTARPLGETTRRDHVAEAVAAFGRLLETDAADRTDPAAIARGTDGRGGAVTPLLLHIAALLAATGTTASGSDPVRALLDREVRRYWLPTLADAGFDPGDVGGGRAAERVRRAAVALACLAPAGTSQEVDRFRDLLAVISDLRDEDRRLVRVLLTDWLADLHPGDREINPLEPDLLADRLIDQTLAAYPSLAADLYDRLRAPNAIDQIARLLDVLARASAQPHVRAGLVNLLDRHLETLVADAVGDSASATTPTSLAAAIDNALTAAQPTTLPESILAALPRFSLPLVGLAATLTRLFYETARTPHDRGYYASDLAVRLADAGRRDEALAAAEEAVTIRRQLAAANPAAYTPDLAASVNNLAVRLAEAGRRDEASAARAEAEELRARLDGDDIDSRSG